MIRESCNLFKKSISVLRTKEATSNFITSFISLVFYELNFCNFEKYAA